jgi:integrase
VNAFARGKNGNESIYVPTKLGGPIQRSTGSTVPAVVRGMKRMVVQLADEHRWITLEALEQNRQWTPPGEAKPRRLTLADIYLYHSSNQLTTLEGLLSAKNLADHLDAWIAWVRANRDEDVRTADVYWQQVTTLVPVGGRFAATELTKERVKVWLSGREKASSGTRRKYLYALKSFVAYLVDAGVYDADPLAGMKAPKKNRARERWESATVDQRIVEAASPKYRALFAFIKATGCDVGSARRAQKGDIDLAAARAEIRGTKTDRRKVHGATIERWALPILTEHLKPIVGRHTPLFAGITNSGASHHHAHCCAAVGVDDYTLKDARHSVGVRMRLAGRSFEEIAEQLGTSVYQAVTVYTRYRPAETRDANEVQA